MNHLEPQREAFSSRLVKYADLVPCRNAFIDAYTPGSDQKENFTIIGPGVAESPDQHVHIDIPHGFNIGGARQPPGCTNSQHSHETAEVFVVHSGDWAFRLGEAASDAEIVLHPGDVISIPTNVFRGFENVGDSTGFLFAVLGGDDPGHVMWAPQVFEAAERHGLVLLQSGQLIDTTKGQAVPDDAVIMSPTTQADVDQVRRMTANEIAACVVRAEDLSSLPAGGVSGSGVTESAIIGDASAAENLGAGHMVWPHGFHLRRLNFDPEAETPFHSRLEPEVLFVQSGNVELEMASGDTLFLGAGDVFTTPIGLEKRMINTGSEPALLYVVRGTDQPSAAELA